jgi:hypothetical protein
MVALVMLDYRAEIGQLVDQRVENPRVAGSIPALGTASAVPTFISPATSGCSFHEVIAAGLPSGGGLLPLRLKRV